jgi:hypothetical protein
MYCGRKDLKLVLKKTLVENTGANGIQILLINIFLGEEKMKTREDKRRQKK